MARRFPALQLVGVEFEPDSVMRARANVESAGLSDRIVIRQADVSRPGPAGEYDLAYFQYAIHQLTDPVAALRAAWESLRPGGRIVVLDWPLPSTTEEFRTRHGELIAGVQIDELYQGTALADAREAARVVRGRGAPGAAPHRPAVRCLGAAGRAPELDRRPLLGDGDRALHLGVDRAVERVACPRR